MSQHKALFSQHTEVRAGMKQKSSSQSDPSDALGSTIASPRSADDISSLLKPNSVVALSSIAAEGEGKCYAVRCLVAGVWTLQMQADLQLYDPTVQLVVTNQNGKLGLRSAIAEGRLLCCNRQYHLGFERWQMDYAEAWSLRGSSLSNCTLRNEMYRITLNIRITVLAKPTDLLGNLRITSAMMTTPLSRHTSAASSKSNSVSSSHVKEDSEQKGRRSLVETPRLLLVKPGTSLKVANPFTHQRDRSNFQEAILSSTEFLKTGAKGKSFVSSDNLHESKETSVPRGGVFTFSSSVKTDSSLRTQNLTEEGKPDRHRLSLKSSATSWKPTTPSRNEGQLSSFSATARMLGPETHSVANLHARNGNRISATEISPPVASTSESQRKVRKWKRNIDGNRKGSSVDFEAHNRPSCPLKRCQEPLFMDVMAEDGMFIPQGSSDGSISPGDGGRSPEVVIKRQSGFCVKKVDDVDLSPTMPHCDLKGTRAGNSGEKLKYSKRQLEAALTNLRKDTALQEKEKAIHWKLQAAVRLLKTETEHKVTMIAKAAFEEAYARTFRDDKRRNSWFSKDVSLDKRAASSKKDLRAKTIDITSHQNQRPWTYPIKRVSPANKGDVSLSVSNAHGDSSTCLKMFLKLWFFLPVPLLSLAYVTLTFRRKTKKADT